MTRKEAMKEMVELQLTFPIPPREGDEVVRADETARRIHALWGYVFCDDPAPADGWKSSVPAPTGEERERHILHWANVQIAEIDAAFASLRRTEGGEA